MIVAIESLKIQEQCLNREFDSLGESPATSIIRLVHSAKLRQANGDVTRAAFGATPLHKDRALKRAVNKMAATRRSVVRHQQADRALQPEEACARDRPRPNRLRPLRSPGALFGHEPEWIPDHFCEIV